MSQPIRVLLLEHDDAGAERIMRALGAHLPGCRVLRARRLPQARRALRRVTFDVILLDLALPGTRGLSGLAAAQAAAPGTPVIVLADPQQEALALRAVLHGAREHLSRTSVFDTLLVRAVRHAAEQGRAERSRRGMEAELRQQRDLNRAIVDTAACLVVVLDDEGRVVSFNPTAERLTGRRLDDVVGARFWELSPTTSEAALVRNAIEAVRTGSHPRTFEGEWLDSLGARRAITWAATALRGHQDRTELIIATGLDTTERKRAEEQLLRAALHDPLTGLPNRSLFLDRLDQAIRMRQRHPELPFALMFLDLDRFKVVNDSLGHAAGDTLLVAVANRLLDTVRDVDTVARLGGDEFGVLLESVEAPEAAAQVAERLVSELERRFHVSGHEVYTSASVGIALGDGSRAREDLLREADTAMYRAKSEGRGRFRVYDGAMHARARDLLHLETELRRALANGEFVVHYQPVVRPRTGRLVGFEALVRWQHPERGLMLPMEFIPLAEETGLIGTLGLWILREACTQLQRWNEGRRRSASERVVVSVNLSNRQFLHADLVDEIEAVLRDTGADPDCLMLEMTESTVMHDAGDVAEMLGRLRALGVRLCIDDFGTGYSSLGALRHFPIDTLKIDRSFIADLSEGNPEIVRTIIALAHNLGMISVAEGVETPAQLAAVQGLRANLVQGFLFSRAITARHAAELLEGRRRLEPTLH